MKIQLLGSRFRQPVDSDAPDLHSQLESLLDCVWRAEAMWSLEDRVSLAIRFEPPSGPGFSGRPPKSDEPEA